MIMNVTSPDIPCDSIRSRSMLEMSQCPLRTTYATMPYVISTSTVTAFCSTLGTTVFPHRLKWKKSVATLSILAT